MDKSAASGRHRRFRRSYFSANGYTHATIAGGLGASCAFYYKFAPR
jgi:hypothetical protein